jgi:hypothetical protein
MAWGYTNDYSSTILAYTSGASSIIVVSVTGLPVSGMYFILKVDSEYFLCTSYTGLVLTVIGGQAWSTPANHSLGAAITGCWIVPQVLDGIKSDIIATSATIWADEAEAASIAIYHDSGGNYGFTIGTGGANGDSLTFSFVLAAGTYTFSVMGQTGVNRGIIDWYVDDSIVLTGQDWYNGSAIFNTIIVGSVTITTSGKHVLKATINSKNGSSSGYYMSLTKMWFRL